jgi:hypothetical protein
MNIQLNMYTTLFQRTYYFSIVQSDHSKLKLIAIIRHTARSMSVKQGDILDGFAGYRSIKVFLLDAQRAEKTSD